MNELPTRPDLSGYQNVRAGHVLKGDLLIWDDGFYIDAQNEHAGEEIVGTDKKEQRAKNFNAIRYGRKR